MYFHSRHDHGLLVVSVMSARCAHHFGTRLLQLLVCKVFFLLVGCIRISSGPWRSRRWAVSSASEKASSLRENAALTCPTEIHGPATT